jgi:hypothetical protein
MLTFRTKYTIPPLHRNGTVTIVLSQYSLDRDRDLCLTHECKTIEEVRGEVDRLKKELDAIVEQAAHKLKG